MSTRRRLCRCALFLLWPFEGVYKRWDGTTASVVQWQREGLNSNAACREGRPKKAVEGEERNRERKRARERGRKRKRTRKWLGQRSGGRYQQEESQASKARQGKARKAGGKELEKRVAWCLMGYYELKCSSHGHSDTKQPQPSSCIGRYRGHDLKRPQPRFWPLCWSR